MDNNKNIPVDENNVVVDHDQLVKVLSPGMLVFKRFIRNRLAIVGVCCILAMFIFSFLGGVLMPYSETEIFTTYTEMSKDYAGVSQNAELRYTVRDGKEFPLIARSQFVLAKNNGETAFESQDVKYSIEAFSDDFYRISTLVKVAEANSFGKALEVRGTEGFEVSAEMDAAFKAAVSNKETSFTADGMTYIVENAKKTSSAFALEPVAVAGMNMYDFANADAALTYDFQFAAEHAALELDESGKSEGSFELDGVQYAITLEDDILSIRKDGELYAQVSDYIVQPILGDVFISLELKSLIKQNIADGVGEFTYTEEDGTVSEFSITRNNLQWTIRQVQETLVIDKYQSPSKTHPLGTDGNGMDLLTRIMYGGRISLMIGFIVVIIETVIGVILGGVAGYFGKWVDNLIMRIVDIFNCIPSTPLLIILGSVMNGMRVDPQIRMIYLMLILGFLGWPGIARLVRGQILSLREQEFMVATEATGLAISRRIFRHLVPNVIPQLIVNCTMALGGVILTEATLSFLGLGVKFPFASWGNIINDVSNVYVMTNYWFVWIPAGFCILITVLGFNFIGDGLRDAFDPKMKR